jgi:hypothetical protein
VAITAVIVLACGATLFAIFGLVDPGGDGGSRAGTVGPGASGSRGARDPGLSPASTPTAPAAASAHSLQGATAFAGYWFETLNFALATGNTGPLEAASSPNCTACGTALALVRGAYRDGGSLRGGAYALREARADNFWSLEKPSLHLVYDRSPRSALTPGGETRDVVAGVTFGTGQLLLERVDDRWRILDLLAVESFI